MTFSDNSDFQLLALIMSGSVWLFRSCDCASPTTAASMGNAGVNKIKKIDCRK